MASSRPIILGIYSLSSCADAALALTFVVAFYTTEFISMSDSRLCSPITMPSYVAVLGRTKSVILSKKSSTQLGTPLPGLKRHFYVISASI